MLKAVYTAIRQQVHSGKEKGGGNVVTRKLGNGKQLEICILSPQGQAKLFLSVNVDGVNKRMHRKLSSNVSKAAKVDQILLACTQEH